MILASIVVHGISVPILEREITLSLIFAARLFVNFADGRTAAKVTRSWSIQPRGDNLSTKFQYRNSGSARSSVRDISVSDTALVHPSAVRPTESTRPSTPVMTRGDGPQSAGGDARVAFADP